MKQIVFIIAVLAGTLVQAQTISWTDKSYIGVRGGVGFSSMSFSSTQMNYPMKTLSSGLFGVFGEYRFDEAEHWAVRPEIMFLSRGGEISDKFKYSLHAQYVDLRVSAIYAPLSKEAVVRPYVMIAPNVGTPYNGLISYNDQSIQVTNNNLSGIHFGVFGGLGVSFPVVVRNVKLFEIGLEAGYNFGITDSYSPKEKAGEVESLNGIRTSIDGSRSLGNIEMNLSITIPLNVFGKAARKKILPPPPKPQPIKEEPIAEAPVVVVEKKKPCYLLDEIIDLIDQGKDVTGKKICAIDGVISFDTNKDTFSKASEQYLNKIIALMTKSSNMHIAVFGHTDNVGREEYNLSLSQRRARSVYNYLIKGGISASRLLYKGFGMSLPIADNSTLEGRSVNRRVEFEISYK